jgi:hypothetical protein
LSGLRCEVIACFVNINNVMYEKNEQTAMIVNNTSNQIKLRMSE